MAVAVQTETERKIDARFEAHVLDFLAYLEFERGLARNTLEAYLRGLLLRGDRRVLIGGKGGEVRRAGGVRHRVAAVDAGDWRNASENRLAPNLRSVTR
jgi:site-specific recombinase XerD